MNTGLKRKIIFLWLIFIFAVILGISQGPANLNLAELFKAENRQILNLRIARLILAIVSASGLSVCGVVLQALLRNPLAEPYLLGTSSGAGLAAVIAAVIGVSSRYTPFVAFIGAILSILLVYRLSQQRGKIGTQSLILSGVIVSIAFSAIIILLLSISNRETLQGISWWLWGSLEVFDFTLLFVATTIITAGVILTYIFSQDLNAISIGEEQAIHLGINTEAVKKILFFIVSLITAAAVSICGIIGFVGLVIPHISRLIIGPNHRRLIPVSCMFASSFMILSDFFSRIVFAPVQIPIGAITAIVGAPIFIVLLKKNQA
jgi:iron complex transport system permease protein